MTVAVTTIMTEVGARLGNITTGNGYNTTAAKIDLARLRPFQGHDLPAINYWPTKLDSEKNKYGGDSRIIHLFVEYHSKTRDEPFTTLAEKLAADVVHGLNRATGAPQVSDDISPNLGGTVTDIRFLGYDYIIGEGQKPWCGALIQFEIVYQAAQNNMATYSD